MFSHVTSTRILIAMLAIGNTPLSLHAHHGAAAYDLSDSRELRGTVAAFHWINPHGLIEVDAREENGRTRRWTAETAGLTILVRAGWSKTALAPGMSITMVGHPARNGEPAMILERVVFDDGRVLGNFVPK